MPQNIWIWTTPHYFNQNIFFRVSSLTCWPGWVFPCASPRAGLSRRAACTSWTRPSGSWASRFGRLPPSGLLFLLVLVRSQQLFLYCIHPDYKWPVFCNKYLNYWLSQFHLTQWTIGSINFKVTRWLGVNFELSFFVSGAIRTLVWTIWAKAPKFL